MVGVAQLVELRIVIPAVEGSNPFVHPNFLQIVDLQRVASWLEYEKIDDAKVAELVDALDLGSSVLRRESSSLSFRTKSNLGVSKKAVFYRNKISAVCSLPWLYLYITNNLNINLF